MHRSLVSRLIVAITTCLVLGPWLASCGGGGKQPPELNAAANQQLYRIGPGDMLKVFVWGNPGLTDTVPVRPDGRISIPLIEDLEVANKTPTEAGRMIEQKLAAFVENPLVTVIVTEFVGPFGDSVRVVGEASQPKSIPYRTDMSLLDVMIEVGGLTEFAAGNRATLIRRAAGEQNQYRVRVDDLLRGGDITANVPMQPGDVLIIPESYF
jgi:polysaccharide biosynthesis/export protein